MANAIGDLAFPDNVNRRKRAGELHDDIVTFGANFQKLLNERYVCKCPVLILYRD